MKKLYFVFIFVVIVSVFLGLYFSFHEKYIPLKTVTQQDVNKILETKRNDIIYVGRPSCPYCQRFKPILEKKLKQAHATFDYYNIDSDRKRNNQQLRFYLSQKLKTHFVPSVIVIKRGKVTKVWNGDDSLNELDSIVRSGS